MIKIFLVEDEVIIRNGIKNSIDWEKEGYVFVGEAGDGELAYPLILREKPDILLTDIKMPFMDGLELSEAVRRELPDTKIIVLSGHNDFEFAQRGIEIGITNYLLKPICAEDLLAAIGEVAETIRRERTEREQLRRYEEEQDNLDFERRRLFDGILAENMPIPDILEAGGRLHLNLAAQMYTIILFKFVNYGEPDLQQQLLDAYMCVSDRMEKQPGVCVFPRDVKGWAFLLLASDEEEIENRVDVCTQTLSSLLEAYPQVEYFGGIGSPVPRLSRLRESFREAERAFAGRFVARTNQIVTWRQLHGNEEPEVTGLGTMQENRQLIAKFLRNGAQEEADSFVQTYFDEILADNVHSMMMRQYVMMDMYITVVSFGEEIGIVSEAIQEGCGDIHQISQYVGSVERSQEYVKHLLESVLRLRDQTRTSSRRYRDILETAKSYMKQQYMTNDISLGKVASSVGMSASYFSSLFREESGQTFVEYLTELRMEKASELLMCSDKRTSEIAFEVGYRDAHYFSYLFKKIHGCSPKEYRGRRTKV